RRATSSCDPGRCRCSSLRRPPGFVGACVGVINGANKCGVGLECSVWIVCKSIRRSAFAAPSPCSHGVFPMRPSRLFVVPRRVHVFKYNVSALMSSFRYLIMVGLLHC
ncbi:unnamed protein product, partial [Ectocarpus fasciculatus]